MDLEREEGELTDEELEDVSDSSICLETLILNENCREPFRELSLTSVSEESSDDLSVIEVQNDSKTPKVIVQNKRKQIEESYAQKRTRYSRNKYGVKFRKRLSSTSSDSEDYISDRKLLRQLREAVSISSTKKNPNCSLRTRIKRMIEPDSPKKSDEDLDNLRDQALKSKNTSSNTEIEENHSVITDEDLQNLRLIALHSAVLKKHQNRRKRKEQENADKEKELTENKIQDNQIDIKTNEEIISETDKIELKSKENVSEIVKSDKTQEEDEDILRAMLLTSISKKITKNDAITKTNLKTTDTKPQTIPKIPVKRLIINVNSDSESETDKKTLPKQKLDGFEQDLSKLLKEARMKSEQQQSDISKHLPRSQQIEYRRLKKKLQLLSKQNMHKYKKLNIENKHIKRNTETKKTLSYKLDRLQMKGKYEKLGPLMTKISKAREARDTAENDVKRLINELKEARLRLTTTHKTYSVLIQQLQQAKNELDQRTNILHSSVNKDIKKICTIPKICTSTPLKENIKENVCDISNIIEEKDKISEEKLETVVEINQLPEEIDKNIIDNEIINIDEKIDNEDNSKIDKIMTYNSPLDHIQSKSGDQYEGNPLLVLCPYDLLGVCRDPECKFRH